MHGINVYKLARKELENIKDHGIELENLAILSHLRHPNILELLASYTYKDKHNLVTPLAEGGTLADLFASDRQTTPFLSNESFFIGLTKLSSAIEHVHNVVENRIDLNLIGCHHDLRPKNILVSRGALLLADFGLSRFKGPTESSGTIFEKGAGDYRAPECEDISDALFSKFVIRRSSDIWSFGCIVAEVATYMILGRSGVEEFKRKRRFKKGQGYYYLFHCGRGEQNVAVNEWLIELAQKSSTSCKLLLDLVGRMLSTDEKERPKARDVTTRLRFIALQEVVDTVDKLFSLIVLSRSLDVLIEQNRFAAWKYAIGLLDHKKLPTSYGAFDLAQPSQFDSVLDCLCKLRDYLQSISSKTKTVRQVVFSPLGGFNDRLNELLDGRLQEKSKTYFKTSMFDSGDAELMQSIRDDIKGVSFDKEIRMRATLKHMTELVMQHHKADPHEQGQLDSKTVKFDSAFGNHDLGFIQEGGLSRQVLVEWRVYGRKSTDETINDELFARVDAITDLLSKEKPEEFRALDCRGFFHDPYKFAFGIVYNCPSPFGLDSSNLKSKTLQDYITETTASIELYPALEDRFRLAHVLARSVLEFHLVGWLHRDLTSANVAFFAAKIAGWEQMLPEPYVVGFNHSRPDEVSAFTMGPTGLGNQRYHHPEYLDGSRRYCAEFDYYSLGIILLEIGLWRPIGEITRKFKGSPKDVRNKLLEERIPMLKQSMGRRYCEAARVCLAGDFAESEITTGYRGNAKSLHLSFEGLVVSQLDGVTFQ